MNEIRLVVDRAPDQMDLRLGIHLLGLVARAVAGRFLGLGGDREAAPGIRIGLLGELGDRVPLAPVIGEQALGLGDPLLGAREVPRGPDRELVLLGLGDQLLGLPQHRDPDRLELGGAKPALAIGGLDLGVLALAGFELETGVLERFLGWSVEGARMDLGFGDLSLVASGQRVAEDQLRLGDQGEGGFELSRRAVDAALDVLDGALVAIELLGLGHEPLTGGEVPGREEIGARGPRLVQERAHRDEGASGRRRFGRGRGFG